MQLCRQLITCYLAGCLAFAGVVGLSPVLHYGIEHGGRGSIHSHLVSLPRVSKAGPAAQDGRHRHQHPRTSQQPNRLFDHSFAPSDFSSISLARLCHAFCHFLDGSGPASSQRSSSDDQRGHEHHSLAQMMVSGCVEQSLDVPLLDLAPGALVAEKALAHPLLLAFAWNAQTASRAPPSARS